MLFLTHYYGNGADFPRVTEVSVSPGMSPGDWISQGLQKPCTILGASAFSALHEKVPRATKVPVDHPSGDRIPTGHRGRLNRTERC